MSRFFVPLMGTPRAFSAASGNLEGDVEGHEALDFNPDFGIKTKVAVSNPSFLFDRENVGGGGSVTDGGIDAIICHLRNAQDFYEVSGNSVEVVSALNSTFSSGVTNHGSSGFFVFNDAQPNIPRQWTGLDTNRYWRLDFTLTKPADIGLVMGCRVYDIPYRHHWEGLDTEQAFNTGVLMPSGIYHSRSELTTTPWGSVVDTDSGHRFVVMRFDVLDDTGIAMIRDIYDRLRGSHFPFLVNIERAAGGFYHLARLPRSADAGLGERRMQKGLWTVDLPIEFLNRVPWGYVW